MKTFIAVFALALCNCAIVQGLSAQPQSLLTNTVNALIQNVKPKLKDLEILLIDLGENGNITDAILQNLDQFDVTDLVIGNALALEVKTIAINVNPLKLLGKFNFVNLDLPVVGTVSGAGSIDANLVNANIWGSLSFTFKGLSLVVKDIYDIGVTVDSADAVLEGIDQSLADAVNGALTQIVPVSIPKLIEDNKDSIIAWLNENLL